MLYCGPVMPMRAPSAALTLYMVSEMVIRSVTISRKSWSFPPVNRARRDTVNATLLECRLGRSAGLAPSLGDLSMASDQLEVARFRQERGFDRNMPAVVHGIVELPKNGHSGQLNNLSGT